MKPPLFEDGSGSISKEDGIDKSSLIIGPISPVERSLVNIFSQNGASPTVQPTVSRRHDPKPPSRIALNPTQSPITSPSSPSTNSPQRQRTRLPTTSSTQGIGIPWRKPTARPSNQSNNSGDDQRNSTSTKPPSRFLSPSPSQYQLLVTYPPSFSNTSKNSCTVLSDGSYGTTTQDSMATILSFHYQMETNVSSYKDLQSLVGKVEIAVSNMLIQNLIQECQPRASNGSRRIRNEDAPKKYHRTLIVQGINSLPGDVIQNGETCPTPSVNPNNTCVVIHGGVTLYGDSNSTRLHDQETTYTLIQNAMATSAFQDLDSSIIRLKYLGIGNTTIYNPNIIHSGSGSLHSPSIVAITSSLLVIICFLFVARRYLKQKHKQALKQQDDGHDDSMNLLEIQIPHDTVEDCTGLLHSLDEDADECGDDSVSTSAGDGSYDDSSEVIVLNELGEELWLSLAETKPQSDCASCTLIASDHSSVHSQTFDVWLYSDDRNFV